MDKPLDFSMNSYKEKTQNHSENELIDNSKGKRESNDVCKEAIAEIDKDQNGNENDNLKIKNSKNEPKGNFLGS